MSFYIYQSIEPLILTNTSINLSIYQSLAINYFYQTIPYKYCGSVWFSFASILFVWKCS